MRVTMTTLCLHLSDPVTNLCLCLCPGLVSWRARTGPLLESQVITGAALEAGVTSECQQCAGPGSVIGLYFGATSGWSWLGPWCYPPPARLNTPLTVINRNHHAPSMSQDDLNTPKSESESYVTSLQCQCHFLDLFLKNAIIEKPVFCWRLWLSKDD